MCLLKRGNVVSIIKSSVDKIKKLEAEKLSLIAEVEELKRLADAKGNVLAIQIAALKEEINSLKAIMGEEEPQLPSRDKSNATNLAYVRAVAEKTLKESSQLGNQVFLVSPYNQNFDNWLANLKQIVLDFEANSPIKADDYFVKDCSQIFLDVEGALSKIKIDEQNVGAVAKALADSDYLLAETDKEYVEKAMELSLKRDDEVQRITNRIHELEREVQGQDEDNNKRKILKKKTDDKIPRAWQDLKAAKNELEMAQQNFTVEQGKLRDSYEMKKQDIIAKVESLRKKLEKLETDASIEVRQVASKALANAVNDLVERASSIA